MSMHVFHDIFLHVVWHTRDDEPILTGETEAAVHRFLRQRCAQTKGVFLHAVGGTENHVHLALSIEPFVNVSDLVGDLKGASSWYLNKTKGFKALYWQRGYGVVSFGRKNLPFVLRYVANQKEHHSKATIHERLEVAAKPGPRRPKRTPHNEEP